jgi:hypothetical protein
MEYLAVGAQLSGTQNSGEPAMNSPGLAFQSKLYLLADLEHAAKIAPLFKSSLLGQLLVISVYFFLEGSIDLL